MPRIDIHTVLGCCPKPPKHEILVITRGATSTINFTLFDKVYTMDYIEQMTFTFKQGKDIYYYNMIQYFELTKDTTIKTGKIYYRRDTVNVPVTSPYIFTPVVATVESLPYLYERSDLPNGQDPENWQFDPHFVYHPITGYEYVSFAMSSEETKIFKPTAPDCNIQFEVAIRLDTDDRCYEMAGSDSIIITPMHPIAVVDSLYSKIGE